MTTDAEKYSTYIYKNKRLYKIELWQVEEMIFSEPSCWHHYIKKQDYKRNEEWFKQHNVQQKMILIPEYLHEQIHRIAIKNLSDEEFYNEFGMFRNELLFNRKSSIYD